MTWQLQLISSFLHSGVTVPSMELLRWPCVIVPKHFRKGMKNSEVVSSHVSSNSAASLCPEGSSDEAYSCQVTTLGGMYEWLIGKFFVALSSVCERYKHSVVILDACRMCEPLGIIKLWMCAEGIQVQLSLTVIWFKCNLSVNRFVFERVIKQKN